MANELGQLVPIDGGTPIPLVKTRCIIGRAPDCDIVLPHRTVSGKHCLLDFRDGSWYVTDLASSNGVYVNNDRKTAAHLPAGVVLAIAEYPYRVTYSTNPAPVADISNLPTAPPGELNAALSGISATDLGKKAAPAPNPNLANRSVENTAPVLGTLIPLDGGDEIVLRGVRLLVGRSTSCNIQFSFPEISSKHCQLDFQNGLWTVRDLGSRNGTYVDGKLITSTVLQPSSILTLARRRFKLAYTPPPPPPSVPVDDGAMTMDLGLVQPADRVLLQKAPSSISSLELLGSGELPRVVT